ncbi:TonB-dependent receptor [Brevundimonas sp.]|uniref:TonB-dependent receptor domain-containing protein n=1 Tax=Brevundimonas sp. TaxID=1871086 RepID=UPI0025C1B2B2|nr:TonB-dependent receptor [Brevundimonas sp.]
MHRHHHRRSALLVTSALAAGIAFPAFAQQADVAQEVDEIVVTGSRIAVAAENAQQPLQLITAEAFDSVGATNVADVLDRAPALLASESRAQADGTSVTLNLRGLGSNRTLVLVDGKRHVAGVPGSAAVDVSTIPSALVERVEVLTGGASAVYGSDAVTGVVNFIINDDFVGTEFEGQYGVSRHGDGEETSLSFTHGRRFGQGDKGHVAFSIQATVNEPVFAGDRRYLANNGQATDQANPARYFQEGDPLPAGVSPYQAIGRSILLTSGAPRYAGTDPSLLDRARNAPSNAILPYGNFHISSTDGVIGWDPYGIGYAGGADASGYDDFINTPDLDGNGVHDCLQSFGGRGGPGWFVGCWVTDRNTGQIRPFQDGLIAGSQNSFGGDGAEITFNGDSIAPENHQVNANLFLSYEVSPLFKPYLQVKAVKSDDYVYAPYSTYDDSIRIQLDNPFIPTAIREIIDAEIAADPAAAGGLVTLSRDHADLADPLIERERETIRVVGGFEGEFSNGWSYDVSLNYGRTEQASTSSARQEDRFFAALDAVIDPATGQATCRVNLDPTSVALPSSLGTYYPGYVTFDPTGGECLPLNLFGQGNDNTAAAAWAFPRVTDRAVIEQKVVSAVLVGNSEPFFSLPAGPIGFAVGAEYREEDSDYTPDALNTLWDATTNPTGGLPFRGIADDATRGGFDVKEVFAELSIPLLADLPFAEILTVSVAGRYADYSTIGEATTWKIDGVWAPIEDIRFRGGYSEAIRAPNIAELYSPLTSQGFQPNDPCDINFINLDPDRYANCLAFGVPVDQAGGWTNPATAQFYGQTGGNPNLAEETAETWTLGVVLRPRFIPGLTATVDYWNIAIDNAVASVSAQDIVDFCYDSDTGIDNQYCALVGRDLDPSSIYYGALDYLLQTQLNFASTEAAGYDFSINYGFDLASLGRPAWGSLDLTLNGTYLETNQDYPSLSDPDFVNPALGQASFPEWALNASARWKLEPFTVYWNTSYQSRQSIVEIEDVDLYTTPFADEVWISDASVRWDMDEATTISVGVNNIFEERPFINSVATPVSAMGRFFFARITGRF